MKTFPAFHSLDLPPELVLILACLRILPAEEEVKLIGKLSKSKIAWPDFLRWVDRHRVAPLVYSNLSRFAANNIPSDIMNDLRSRFESNAHRGLRNAAELVRLSMVFHQKGIPVLPLKGSVLALQVYGNLALRHAGDIDLLVFPNHVELADRLLRQEYSRIMPGPFLTPYQQNRYNGLFNQYAYIQDQTNLHLELHWKSIYFPPSHIMEFTGVQSRAKYVTVAGSHLPVMPREDTILYLCAHGAEHYWNRLFWLVDLAEIIRQDQELNWNQLMSSAIKLDLVRHLVLGVGLAHLFLNAPLPDSVRAYIRHDRIVPYLTKIACWYILSPEMQRAPFIHRFQRKVYLLRLWKNSTYKFKALKRIIVGTHPWERTGIPDTLFLPYCVLWFLLWPYWRPRQS